MGLTCLLLRAASPTWQGSMAHARTFLESLKIFTVAESLGAVESLAESP